ncbi:Leucine-rich repeat receptor protein kinase [Quillaja saponaria]|uniref:Leucine-rich repeat receptor protein kinase n=1 Tax=Quillaja saponaria TaxID=32244 RepID=A0AAD7PMH8_QUISA|nr:Leucine-rich repeat receptor protein kinase [Quillaja saponaria]
MGRQLSTVSFVVVVFFFFEIAQICMCLNNSTLVSCIEGEKQALLMFKKSLQDRSNRLFSWKGNDCCNWEGVGCDAITGHVNKLDLSSCYWLNDIEYNFDQCFKLRPFKAPDVNSCLLELKYLNHLDLSGNGFNGSQIPVFFGSFKKLRYLNLSNSALGGRIPDNLGNLTDLRVIVLGGEEYQDNSETLFANDVDWVSKLSSLQHLDMSFGQLTRLEMLDLASNQLNGVIPVNLGYPVNMSSLDLSKNNLNGIIPISLGSLYFLNLAHSQLNGVIPNIPVNSEHLFLGNNLINWSIPNSLCSKTSLQSLDLSSNKLSGKIPNCWNGSSSLELINLSANELSGNIPSSFGNISTLYWLNLSNNSLQGELPLALTNRTNLEIMDLGENLLSGHIPSWIGETLSSLKFLRLPWNTFNAVIPHHLCQLLRLQILDLANNNLTGSIPNCIGYLRGMSNLEAASAPTSLSWSDQEGVKQVIKGRELEYTKNLRFVVNLDLSSNNLVGVIPEGLTLLSGLHGLNLSHNHLSGEIPQKIGEMQSLESVDFSGNQLSGRIPKSMSSLTLLSYLNLSHNNFSGPIPRDNQFSTLDDQSNYAGNSFLCGDPLPKRCPGNYIPQAPGLPVGHHEEDEDDKKEKLWFYFVIALGFATGFWTVIGILFFKKSWRHAYFRSIEKAADRVYVEIEIKVARLKKRMANNQADLNQ